MRVEVTSYSLHSPASPPSPRHVPSNISLTVLNTPRQ
jgi:hypothetical protein